MHHSVQQLYFRRIDPVSRKDSQFFCTRCVTVLPCHDLVNIHIMCHLNKKKICVWSFCRCTRFYLGRHFSLLLLSFLFARRGSAPLFQEPLFLGSSSWACTQDEVVRVVSSQCPVRTCCALFAIHTDVWRSPHSTAAWRPSGTRSAEWLSRESHARSLGLWSILAYVVITLPVCNLARIRGGWAGLPWPYFIVGGAPSLCALSALLGFATVGSGKTDGARCVRRFATTLFRMTSLSHSPLRWWQSSCCHGWMAVSDVSCIRGVRNTVNVCVYIASRLTYVFFVFTVNMWTHRGCEV